MRIQLEECLFQLNRDNPHYFEGLLPPAELWRLFPEFRYSTAFLDIETTGMDGWSSSITTIALYDGESILHYVRGFNLNDFKEDIQKYKVIVTYNGRCFDVPFIRRDLGLAMDQVHIDLRFVLRRLGYKGGLKGCERQMGIQRGDLEGVDGYFAVLLWNDFVRNGNRRALETLLAYNIQDVVNLERLIVLAYNRNLTDTPFAASRALAEPTPPAVPFEAHKETIERIRRQYVPVFSPDGCFASIREGELPHGFRY